jgi:hypothetical protein
MTLQILLTLIITLAWLGVNVAWHWLVERRK